TGWVTNTNSLSVLGDDRVDMILWDAVLQLYANVYYTTDEQLDQHVDRLFRMVADIAPALCGCRGEAHQHVGMFVEL
ncbi:nitrate ABC transporter substrate-binding protein, partial [Rhizobium ruizarguesonis]